MTASTDVLDVLFVGLSLAFFAVGIGYVAICDWLSQRAAGKS